MTTNEDRARGLLYRLFNSATKSQVDALVELLDEAERRGEERERARVVSYMRTCPTWAPRPVHDVARRVEQGAHLPREEKSDGIA